MSYYFINGEQVPSVYDIHSTNCYSLDLMKLTNIWTSLTLKSLDRRADRNKLLAYLLSKLINEQGGIFCLLHEKLRAGWKENLKNLSEHALLLGTSE